MPHRPGFTILQLALVMVGVLVLLTWILPSLRGRGPHRRLDNQMRLRGIHQACVLYANGNSGHYPGLDSAGRLIDSTVEGRLRRLLKDGYFTGEFIISPFEFGKIPPTTQPSDLIRWSYAMPEIRAAGGRRTEWSDTVNSDAPVLCDRNTGLAEPTGYRSLHDPQGWRGSVVWNDGHADFAPGPLLSTAFSVPRGGATHPATAPAPLIRHEKDDLFQPAGSDDAWMIHSGP